MSVLAWAVGHLALRDGFIQSSSLMIFISSSDTLSSESFADPKGFSWFTGCADLWHQGLWFLKQRQAIKIEDEGLDRFGRYLDSIEAKMLRQIIV